MRIFFDTEFTQFRDGELLSIGMVSDDDIWLVVEVHDRARHLRASDFCRMEVLSQFGATAALAVANDSAAGLAIAEWLSQFGVPLDMCYDYKLDWHFLEGALCAAGQWRQLERRLNAVNVAHVASSERCLNAQEAYFAGKVRPGRHHPLIDALALRERWREHEREVPPGPS
jgi:hypothetical protein